MNYSEKFKDPRWQKKRLEILQRDEWMCQSCKSIEDTLTIHHKYYIKDREPWEYPDELLITLCEECHKTEQELLSNIMNDLPRMFLEKFLPSDLVGLLDSINRINIDNNTEILKNLLGAICWYLDFEPNKLIREYIEMKNKARNKNG